MRLALLLMVACAGERGTDTAEPGGLVCAGTYELATMLCDGVDIGPERSLSTFEAFTVTLAPEDGQCVATFAVDSTWDGCKELTEAWVVDSDGTAHESGVSVCDEHPECADGGTYWCDARPALEAVLLMDGATLLVDGAPGALNHIARECPVDGGVTLVMPPHDQTSSSMRTDATRITSPSPSSPRMVSRLMSDTSRP